MDSKEISRICNGEVGYSFYKQPKKYEDCDTQ